jgi:hypothetical protein
MQTIQVVDSKGSEMEAGTAEPDIASGKVGGLLVFMDFMVDKGYGSGAAIRPWKSAARQVFSVVEGDGFEDADARNFDIDEYFARFENRSMGKYGADSLRAYRSRFRKAVEAYRSYLSDPNWKPSMRQSARPPRDSNSKKKPTQKPARTAPHIAREVSAGPPTSSLMTYPFPLKSGQMAQLHLPTQLERDDAERLTHFIRALVFDQPRQLEGGDADRDEES